LPATTAVKKVQHFETANVVTTLEGSDPKLKNEYVVVNAHLDHLGVGRSVEGDSIYNGAMDNASGVASVIEIARSIDNGPPLDAQFFSSSLVERKRDYWVRSTSCTVPWCLANRLSATSTWIYFYLSSLSNTLKSRGLGESTLGNDVRAVAQLNEIEV
jgi:hypothetical protein